MAEKIFYRTFKNMDVWGLGSSWNKSWDSKVRGKVLKDTFEDYVCTNLFFDPENLVVAVESPEKRDPRGPFDGRIVGFVHGGFGPNKQMDGCDKSIGYIPMLIVEDREDQQEIRARLLYEMEKIFFRMGIRTVFVGAVYPNAPFYIGPIFGCDLNGILENDPFLPPILLRNQYVAVERYHILSFLMCNSIRLTFGQQMLISQVVEMVSPEEYSSRKDLSDSADTCRAFMSISRDWWEACAHSNVEEWNRFVLLDRNTSESVAWVGASVLKKEKTFLRLGIHHLYVKPEFRHRGYARLLLTLVLNRLQTDNRVCQVELLVSEKNTSALQMFTGFHFDITSTGNVYRRELPDDFPETFQTGSLEKGTDLHA